MQVAPLPCVHIQYSFAKHRKQQLNVCLIIILLKKIKKKCIQNIKKTYTFVYICYDDEEDFFVYFIFFQQLLQCSTVFICPRSIYLYFDGNKYYIKMYVYTHTRHFGLTFSNGFVNGTDLKIQLIDFVVEERARTDLTD